MGNDTQKCPFKKVQKHKNQLTGTHKLENKKYSHEIILLNHTFKHSIIYFMQYKRLMLALNSKSSFWLTRRIDRVIKVKKRKKDSYFLRLKIKHSLHNPRNILKIAWLKESSIT